MATFVFFIASLTLIVFLFAMKNFELSRGRKIFLEELFVKCDAWIHKVILQIKYWWSHVNFKNTKLVIVWIIVHLRRTAIAIKRRFNHEQSHFFTKRDQELPRSKGPSSFFLKDVSDYKKTLRENKRE